MGKFVDNLPGGLTPFSEDHLYQEAYDKSGYKMSLDRVIKKLWDTEDIAKYYSSTRNLDENLTIISKDEYDIVVKCRELILANPFISSYFGKSTGVVELYHQVPVYFRYKDEDCKALLDGVRVDHINRTIEPFDLKTSKSVYGFPSAMLEYGYYRQCAFYELALHSENSPVKQYIDAGYEIKDFVFIVVENKISSSHPAIIYRTNKYDRKCGFEGGYVNGRYYKGIDQLIDDYKFHRDTDYWDLSRELFEQQGVLNLNLFDYGKSEH